MSVFLMSTLLIKAKKVSKCSIDIIDLYLILSKTFVSLYFFI